MHFTFAVIRRSSDSVVEIMAPYSEVDEDYFEFCPMYTEEDIVEMKKEVCDRAIKKMSNEKFAMWYGGYVKRGDTYGLYENPRAVYDYFRIINGSVPAEAIMNPFGFIDLDGVVHMQDDRGVTPEQHKALWTARLAEASEVSGVCVTFLDCHI